MFGKDKRSRKATDRKSGSPSIVVEGLGQEVDAIVDVTKHYSWRAATVKEIRLGVRADLFRDLLNGGHVIAIGDELYAYAGGSGFGTSGYFVLVEKVGEQPATAQEPVAAPAAIPRATVAQAAPPPAVVEPPVASGPLAAVVEPAPATSVAVSGDSEADVARYSRLTLEEYESLPMSEVARVPPHIVEELHRLASGSAAEVEAPEEAEADDALAQPARSGDSSQLTLDEYEAMPVAEAAKVPPWIVDKLRRRQEEKQQ